MDRKKHKRPRQRQSRCLVTSEEERFALVYKLCSRKLPFIGLKQHSEKIMVVVSFDQRSLSFVYDRQKETVDLFTTKEEGLPYYNTRALGWDTNPNPNGYPCSCGQRFGKNVFGHTGYTGTTIWADKDKDIGIVALTNRVYPNDSALSKDRIRFFRNNLFNTAVDCIMQ